MVRMWYLNESEKCPVCPILCDPMDCSLPGSSVHGILQARIVEWVTVPFFRGSSQSRDWPKISHNAGGFFILEPPGKPIWVLRQEFNYLFDYSTYHLANYYSKGLARVMLLDIHFSFYQESRQSQKSKQTRGRGKTWKTGKKYLPILQYFIRFVYITKK